EEPVFLRRPGGDADGGRRAEAVQRADDHALPEQRLEQRAGVVADVDVEEVRDRRPGGLETMVAEDPAELGHRLGVDATTADELLGVVEAGERSRLRRAGDVERTLDL